MFKSISKAIDQMFTKGGFDVLNQLLLEYGAADYWSAYNYPSYSYNGYEKNNVAYHCIRQIADSVGGIQAIIQVDGKELNPKHDLVKLFKRPNPRSSFNRFMMEAASYKLIAGNCFIHAIATEGRLRKVLELDLFRPDRVTVVPNTFALPKEYTYTVNGNVTIYPVDPITLLSDVLHLKYFHPMNDLYGLSPIQVALMNIDQHNESNAWNQKLLKNLARPSGIYSVKSQTPLSEQQKNDITEKLQRGIQGANNAGMPMVTGMDVSWIPSSLTPVEMDWINSKNVTARDICLAFKFPPYMLGMAEGSTFNNLSEARLSFYEETVIPLTEEMYSELANYLSKIAGLDISIIPDKDKITALAPRREAARTNAINAFGAGLVTLNEGRAEIDYKPIVSPNADVPMLPAGKLPLDFDPASLNPTEPEDDSETDAEDDEKKSN
jgi:HK97 family phage portal protein